ncbi:hypothetical protein FP744_10003136 [Trichoderma asperellum]
MPEMNVINNDKFVVPRSTSESPPPPPPPPPPRPPQRRSPLDPPSPVVAAAGRPLRSAAGDTAFPFAEADDEGELPPSYEISTLTTQPSPKKNSPRPSDAHIHVTVRSNTSASSLPSLMAGRAGGRGSINTQGYLLTAPMSHTTTASSNTAASAYYNLRGLDSRRPSRCEHQWGRWDRRPARTTGAASPAVAGASSPTATDAAFRIAAAAASATERDAAAPTSAGVASRVARGLVARMARGAAARGLRTRGSQ